AARARCLEHVDGADDVALEGVAQVAHRAHHVRLRGEVVDGIGAGELARQQLRVADVAYHQAGAPVRQVCGDVLLPAAVQVVDHHKLGHAVADQPVYEVAADEAGAAGYDHFHGSLFICAVPQFTRITHSRAPSALRIYRRRDLFSRPRVGTSPQSYSALATSPSPGTGRGSTAP